MMISSTCNYQQQKASGTIDINIYDGTNHCFCCLLATYLSLLQYYMALHVWSMAFTHEGGPDKLHARHS